MELLEDILSQVTPPEKGEAEKEKPAKEEGKKEEAAKEGEQTKEGGEEGKQKTSSLDYCDEFKKKYKKGS